MLSSINDTLLIIRNGMGWLVSEVKPIPTHTIDTPISGLRGHNPPRNSLINGKYKRKGLVRISSLRN